MDWRKKVEKIAQATNLPIRSLECSRHEIDHVRMEHENAGWEICYMAKTDDSLALILIQPDHWHSSARSLLELFLTPAQTADPFSAWVTQLLDDPSTPPPRIVLEQTWRERRLLFLLQRCQTESRFEWTSLQPLLKDYFADTDSSIQLVPLHRDFCLLIVPPQVLQTDSKYERENALEWAFGLQELLACEWMETIRVLVSHPAETPASVGEALVHLHNLSQTLQRFSPKTMVAASWLYPLERWASAFSKETTAQVVTALSSVMPLASLSQEQRETLETLFSLQLNVSETARKLFLHRNTLLYRLDKITEATGLDPRHFPDAVLLQLHLLFRHN
jgi:PucR C-terminal helix-turn-helix domain